MTEDVKYDKGNNYESSLDKNYPRPDVPLPTPDPRGDWTHAVYNNNPKRITDKK